MSTRRAIRAISFSALALLLGACGFHSPPTLTVTDLTVSERSADHAVLLVTIDAANSNNEPLPLGEVVYEFTLDSGEGYRGVWDAQATIPREGRVVFTLPAPINAQLLDAPGPIGYRLGGTIEYIPPGALGEALFNARVRTGSAAFRERGELTLSDNAAAGE